MDNVYWYRMHTSAVHVRYGPPLSVGAGGSGRDQTLFFFICQTLVGHEWATSFLIRLATHRGGLAVGFTINSSPMKNTTIY